MAEQLTTGWRTAQTEHGDTLAAVAHRELGDASRWPEIAWLNELLPPYLVAPEHPMAGSGRVVVFGGVVKVPAFKSQSKGLTPDESFGVDLALDGDLAITDGGDFSLVAGVRNLKQALEMRLRAHLGELLFHPRYGNQAHRIKGQKSTANTRLLVLRFCEECLLGDPRVLSVRDGVAEVSGDAVLVSVTAVVDDASPLRLQLDI